MKLYLKPLILIMLLLNIISCSQKRFKYTYRGSIKPTYIENKTIIERPFGIVKHIYMNETIFGIIENKESNNTIRENIRK